MKAVKCSAALLPLLLALGACTTTGFGVGEMPAEGAAGQQVNFHWRSSNGGISGQLTATVADTTYRGHFFQITQQTRDDVWSPQWPSPHHYFNFYPYPYPYPSLYPYSTTRLTTFFTGTVLATLMEQNDQTMRCRFQLADPVSGMSAGGEGSCDLPTGRVVRVVLVSRQR